uniref:THO complex 6 n=1 Tax=Neogobius melanostomus TaxID=47308 RepID=A0A8C6TUP5_9GOBI
MGPVEMLHMSVFSQSFSPCGRFLAVGNSYGEIALFSLSAALSPDSTPSSHKPVLTFTAHEGPVFCLVSSDLHLFSCGNGEISTWSWSHLIKKNAKALWTKRPNYKLGLEIPEINAMILQNKENALVVGAETTTCTCWTWRRDFLRFETKTSQTHVLFCHNIWNKVVMSGNICKNTHSSFWLKM